MSTCTQEYCSRFGTERVASCDECMTACPMCIGKGSIIGGEAGAPVVRGCAYCGETGRVVAFTYSKPPTQVKSEEKP